MKKILVLSLLSLSLVGCGASNAQATTDPVVVEASSEVVEKEVVEKGEVKEEASKYEVQIDKMEVLNIDDYGENKDVLRVDFTFTNNSEETNSFELAMMMKAFQDDVEMNTTFNSEVMGEKGDNSFKDVRPGGSVEVSYLFEVGSKNDIEIEVDEFLATNSNPEVIGVYKFE